jgi:hypothetical protein
VLKQHADLTVPGFVIDRDNAPAADHADEMRRPVDTWPRIADAVPMDVSFAGTPPSAQRRAPYDGPPRSAEKLLES